MVCADIILDTFLEYPGTLVKWVLITIAIISIICLAIVKIYKYAERYRLKRNELDEREELLNQHSDDIKSLNEKYDVIINKIDQMNKSLSEHIEDSRLDNQAILRNEIIHMYQNIKSYKNQYILDRDLQNYISMFDRYSKDLGNGYVHDVVDPFIRNLPAFLSDEQAEEYFAKGEN